MIQKRVLLYHFKELLRVFLQASRCEFSRILSCLLGINELPVHQSRVVEQFSGAALRPFLMDSRMSGMERRNKVS